MNRIKTPIVLLSKDTKILENGEKNRSRTEKSGPTEFVNQTIILSSKRVEQNMKTK